MQSSIMLEIYNKRENMALDDTMGSQSLYTNSEYFYLTHITQLCWIF